VQVASAVLPGLSAGHSHHAPAGVPVPPIGRALDGCFDVCVLLYDWCVAACEPDAGNDVEQLGSVFEEVIRNAEMQARSLRECAEA
jgi:hypothetical protein